MPSRRSKLFPTPEDAESAFYEAFERGDLAAMMSVWAASDDIVCVHPNGPRLVGFEAVRDGWMQIFSGGALLRVRLTDAKKFDGRSVSVHSVVETLSAPGGNPAVTQSVCATNVYELTDSGWRMAVHHASAAPEVAPAEEPPSTNHTLH
jgi:ketosteroid isomerase-like protein